MNKADVKLLIEGLVDEAMSTLLVSEQEDKESAAETAPAESDVEVNDLESALNEPDLSDEEPTADSTEDGTDVDGDEATEDVEGEDSEDFDPETGAPLGGGGGFSGGGGGFSGSFEGGDFDSEGSETDAAATEAGESPEELEEIIPEDPVQSTVDLAIDMRTRTGDDQEILNAIKAHLQMNFEDFNDATPVIEQLWNTDEAVLKAVARKLILFIKGE